MHTTTSPRRRQLLAPWTAAVAVAALVLVGCGDGDDTTASDDVTTTTSAASATPDLSGAEWADLTTETAVKVQARDNVFVKPYIEVKAGTTVTFTNRGRNQHNVIAVPEGTFESIEADDLEPGTSQEVTFTAPGDYPYYCSLHGTTTKGMVGAIRVVE